MADRRLRTTISHQYFIYIVSKSTALQMPENCPAAVGIFANGPAIWGGCVTRSCPDRSVGGSTGQDPGTLATKLSRCKEGMAHFLPSSYRTFWPLRVSRYRAVKELVNYQNAVKFIEGSGAPAQCEQSE